ncbi:MAG: hypothetical protein HXJ92_01795 [candidate division SR1 bacterium]|nr:hypothetical protein [candidate division SR1 bacterium]
MSMTVEQFDYDTGVERKETTDNPYDQPVDSETVQQTKFLGNTLFRSTDNTRERNFINPIDNFINPIDSKSLSSSFAEEVKDIKIQVAENKRQIDQIKGKLPSEVENYINGDPRLVAALNTYGSMNYNPANKGKKVDFSSSESAQEIAG